MKDGDWCGGNGPRARAYPQDRVHDLEKQLEAERHRWATLRESLTMLERSYGALIDMSIMGEDTKNTEGRRHGVNVVLGIMDALEEEK